MVALGDPSQVSLVGELTRRLGAAASGLNVTTVCRPWPTPFVALATADDVPARDANANRRVAVPVTPTGPWSLPRWCSSRSRRRHRWTDRGPPSAGRARWPGA